MYVALWTDIPKNCVIETLSRRVELRRHASSPKRNSTHSSCCDVLHVRELRECPSTPSSVFNNLARGIKVAVGDSDDGDDDDDRARLVVVVIFASTLFGPTWPGLA